LIRIGYGCINTKLTSPNRTCRLKNATPDKILKLAAAMPKRCSPSWNRTGPGHQTLPHHVELISFDPQ
ncbi:MAG TPA: hypothetical protein VF089_15945, partial [Candidatus Binatia bacterium]